MNRDVEDRDFFAEYSSGAHWIVGDPKTIAEAPEDSRLRVAHELASSPDLDLQQGWSAFCQSDPQGAFDSLSGADLTSENGVLWDEFLGSLTIGNTASRVIREDLSVQALEHLERADADILQTLVSSLCYLIFFAPRERVADVYGWLVKLWEAISRQPKPSLDLATDLYERAINSAAGKLSETLLLEIAARTKAGNAPTSEQLHLIKTISTSGGAAGQLGRAVLANDIAFLLALDRQFVEETVGPRIKAETVEGAALRAVMLKFGSITPEVQPGL